jgi:hypothetical protein
VPYRTDLQQLYAIAGKLLTVRWPRYVPRADRLGPIKISGGRCGCGDDYARAEQEFCGFAHDAAPSIDPPLTRHNEGSKRLDAHKPFASLFGARPYRNNAFPPQPSRQTEKMIQSLRLVRRRCPGNFMNLRKFPASAPVCR